MLFRSLSRAWARPPARDSGPLGCTRARPAATRLRSAPLGSARPRPSGTQPHSAPFGPARRKATRRGRGRRLRPGPPIRWRQLPARLRRRPSRRRIAARAQKPTQGPHYNRKPAEGRSGRGGTPSTAHLPAPGVPTQAMGTPGQMIHVPHRTGTPSSTMWVTTHVGIATPHTGHRHHAACSGDPQAMQARYNTPKG